MPGWNNWYHCIITTYGAWLPGDPRGFRTRDHREHVEGDYKSPPPAGKYDQRHRAAKARMTRPTVSLSPAACEIVIEEALLTFEKHNIEGLAISVSPTHMHILARFPMERRKPMLDEHGLRTSSIDDPVRHLVGHLKQWSSKRLIRDGHLDAGAWGKRGKIVPIKDRKHQINVYRYIRAHKDEDAAIWTFKDSPPKDR